MTFKDYLVQIYQYECNDDTGADKVTGWLENMPYEELVELAEKWGNKQFSAGLLQGQRLQAKAFEAVLGIKDGGTCL